MKKTRKQRLEIYYQRLRDAPPAESFDTALRLICDKLDEVEDEFSGEPNDPARWMELNRMFPPQADRIHADHPRPGVTIAVTRGHEILIGSNGSLEFWRRRKTKEGLSTILELSKPGADGRGLPS
jgi:hypothetical protein